ncbi:Leucine-rich repeat transmembrane protein FLRT2 [Manis javanica]|nr:Leucine-rich repeat transmembrane protein FLRT2 [Manis javanica]
MERRKELFQYRRQELATKEGERGQPAHREGVFENRALDRLQDPQSEKKSQKGFRKKSGRKGARGRLTCRVIPGSPPSDRLATPTRQPDSGASVAPAQSPAPSSSPLPSIPPFGPFACRPTTSVAPPTSPLRPLPGHP